MKQFLRILPFVLVLLVVYALQVIWATDDQVKPFLDPFGRASAVGDSGVNRPVQVLGQNRYAWLTDKDLGIGTINPAKQSVAIENRPVPNADLFDHTAYQLVGDDLYWIGGKDSTLKHAVWQQGHWSTEQTIATGADSVFAARSGSNTVLVAGLGKTLKVWTIQTGTPVALRSYPVHLVRDLTGTVDAAGNVQIGAVDERSSSLVDMLYFNVDLGTHRASDLTNVQEKSLPTSMMVESSEFGVDQTHGYFFVTYASSRSFTKSLGIYTFPLSDPANSSSLQSPFSSDQGLYDGYPLAGQATQLQFVAAGQYAKNPRVQGNEVYLNTLQDGKWLPVQHRITNSHGVAVNPVFDKQTDGSPIVLFMMQPSYEDYQIYYNSANPTYAAATNVVTKDDYENSMMQVPQYMGIAVLISMMAIIWPLLSYGYLLYFIVRKKEDTLYDHAERHLLVASVLYILSQIGVFLLEAKMDNYNIYAPTWMHSGVAIAGILFLMGVLSYGLTKVFYSKLRYERQALPEFSYFFILNSWMSLLGFSYFMAS